MAWAEASHSKGRKPAEIPDYPDELDYVWQWYTRLSRRRQSGMAANPITYEAIEAFERKALVHVPAWECDLLMRLDDAVMVALNPPKGETLSPSGKPRAPSQQSDEGMMVSVHDTAGVRAVMRGLAAKKANRPMKTEEDAG